MIDVLLVIIIFLMLTTTYSRFAGLEINLPTADAQASNTKTVEVNVAVTAAGDVVINKRPVNGSASRPLSRPCRQRCRPTPRIRW
jgi:biopolymer transport protein ExbD